MTVVQSSREVTSRVARLIFENHLKRRDVAAAIEMPPQSLTNKLHNRSNYTLKDLTALADYFDVSVDYLLGREVSK